MLMNGGMAGLLGPEHAGDPRAEVRARRPSAAGRSRCASGTGAASAGCCRGRRRRASGSASPRSITLAMFSRPCEILMLSTAVSIAGNVQRIFSTGTPTSNGVYRLGSNVSGAAMPPAIQSRMQRVGGRPRGAATGSSASRAGRRGSPAASVGERGGGHAAAGSRGVSQVSSRAMRDRADDVSPRRSWLVGSTRQRINWNSGSMNTAQSRSATPSSSAASPSIAGAVARSPVGRPAGTAPRVDSQSISASGSVRAVALRSVRGAAVERRRQNRGRWTGRAPAASSDARAAW